MRKHFLHQRQSQCVKKTNTNVKIAIYLVKS